MICNPSWAAFSLRRMARCLRYCAPWNSAARSAYFIPAAQHVVDERKILRLVPFGESFFFGEGPEELRLGPPACCVRSSCSPTLVLKLRKRHCQN